MMPRQCLIAAVLALCGVPAYSQITPILTPFAGMASESFESQPQQQFNPCLPYRVFANQGDLCTPAGPNAHTTPSWSWMCLLFPHTGNLLYGSTGGPTVITLDRPTHRFGGYFASISGTANGTIKFFDPIGNQIGATQIVSAPANCTWVWNGWQSVPSIKRIEFDGNYPFGTGYLMADSLEVDVIPDPVTYCTAKLNSLGCTPAMTWAGAPSIGSSSGFIVSAINVRNNKNGLLFYGLNGQAALPFQGGTLCVKAPIRRTPAVNSLGTPPPANDCSGIFSIDMNSFSAGLLGGTPAPGLLIPGTVVDCQWWGRDPGFPAPNNTTLSEGLEYII